MQQRVQDCTGKQCVPLVWTISPHLAKAAPQVLLWFYAQATGTQSD